MQSLRAGVSEAVTVRFAAWAIVSFAFFFFFTFHMEGR